MVAPAQRAVELDPNDITANFWLSNQLASTGRTIEAELANDRALKADPGNSLIIFYKAVMRLREGDDEAAFKLANQANRGGPLAALVLYEAFAKQGDHDRGAQEFARGFAAFRNGFNKDELAAMYRGRFGDEAARQAALVIVGRHGQDELAGTLLLLLKEPEQSFARFEQFGAGISDVYLNSLWLPQAYSREARQHPEFQTFAKRIGLVDYWKQNRWPDLCSPTPENGPDAFTCR